MRPARSILLASLLGLGCEAAAAGGDALPPPPLSLGAAPADDDVVLASSAPVLPDVEPPKPALADAHGDPQVIFDGPDDVQRVALTFDDGPSEELTPKVLDVLAHYRVKATFFVLGERAAEHPELLKRIVDEGHELGSHGFSHEDFRGLFKSEIRKELVRTADLIETAAGAKPRFMRPPYGLFAESAIPIFGELGLDVVLWSVDGLDWQRSAERTTDTVVWQSREGSIVLLHDRELTTLLALPKIIGSLRGRGLEPVTVSELTGRPAYR